ncbi:PhoH family protein [Candidatus Riflebacteria bacterium]
MPKTFVLDTNVLIHNPKGMFSFDEHNVVIPIVVVEELDGLKGYSDDRGRSARQSARILTELLLSRTDISQGCPLPGGGTITVELPPDMEMPLGLDPMKNDNRVILTALKILKENPKTKVSFVSMDLNARIKAHALGIPTEDFLTDKVQLDELYTGSRKYELSEDNIDLFYKNKCLGFDEIMDEQKPVANEFFLFTDENSQKGKSALARYDAGKDSFVPLVYHMQKPMGIKPLNIEQKFAFELLQDDSIPLVCLLGKAGTGKTLLAIAAGLKKTLSDKAYRKVSVSRPVIPMGKDIGYLPGSKDEKLLHWMRPIFDNLEFIYTQNGESQEHTEKHIQALREKGSLEIEALTYIRGRSLAKDYFIVDEAQNLTPQEVKTIVSRAGEGTKVILTGDIYQIDNPYLDATSNGLTYCVEKFKNYELFGSIVLTRAERSELSELAARIL